MFSESKKVFVAVKFGFNAERTIFLKHVALLRIIRNQNTSALDFCSDMDSFVSDTFSIQGIKRLFKEVCPHVSLGQYYYFLCN